MRSRTSEGRRKKRREGVLVSREGRRTLRDEGGVAGVEGEECGLVMKDILDN